MAACEFCTGTHYLSDSPEMGPCICCTPEAMQRRDRTITALLEPPKLSPLELLDTLEASVSTIRDAFAQAERRTDEANETIVDARALLSDYFVSVGMDADPVTIENRALAAVWDGLYVVDYTDE